ncbi:polysaccharide biosynthesis tyrosine autokinase [Rheinheimera pacifica]|uniref:GumC family protein n=1 Tax=Rheinheimera pacifica TaxID=173990 RepID=UPI002ED97BD7
MAVYSNEKPLASGEKLVDVSKLFGVIGRFKWRILILAVSSAILAASIAQNMTPIYRSTATLLIEAQQARAIKIEEVYGFNSAQQEYYLTQFEILKSRSIAERVFDELSLAGHPALQGKPSFSNKAKGYVKSLLSPPKPASVDTELSSALTHKRRLDKFSSGIQINPVRKTQLVNLSYQSSDPRLAQAVANAIGEAYISSQLDARLGITQKASSWLGGRIGELRERLEQSETRLEAFRAQHNLVDVEGVTALDARELERLNEELTDARSKKAKAEGFLALVRQFDQHDVSGLESLPEITSHPSVQNVKREVMAVERKYSELNKVYGPKHPKMIAVQAELLTVNNSLRQQINRLIEGIEKEAQSAERRLSSLEQQFSRTKTAFSSLGSVESDYRRLQREVETNQLLFDSFFARQKETEVTGDFDAPIARFTDRAVLPSEPVKPNKKLIVMLTFISTLLLGAIIALLQDMLNDTVKNTADIEQVLAQCALGYLPKGHKKKNDQQRSLAYFDPKQRRYSESVRNIRTALSLMALDKPLQVIEITSSQPQEGKTTVSINLAFAFAALERVLLIDADLRKPSVGSRFNLPLYQSGLANILSRTATLDECIVKDVQEGVDIMPAGAIPLNPMELLAGHGLQSLLTELKGRYDKIIIDTAPVQAVSDPLLVAPHADAVVLVVKADHTRIPLVQHTLGQLHQAHARVYGVVLNQMKMNKAEPYYANYGV